jgi:hypothetical protein
VRSYRITRTRDRLVPAFLALAAVLAGGSFLFLRSGPTPASSPDNRLPIWITEANPLGATGGPLVESGGCIYIDLGYEKELLLWPVGYRRDGQDIRDAGGEVVATIGRDLKAYGGEYWSSDKAWVLKNTEPAAIIERCPAQKYWHVTGVSK